MSLRSRLFNDDLGKIILEKTVSLFQNSNICVARYSSLIFVCGGGLDQPSSRAKFRKAFIENQDLKHLKLVIAESAYKALQTTNDFKFHNISNFESLIADLSSCVLIFLESPGSIAELGYFSAFKDVAEKTLVVIDYDNQADSSFIMHGPIDRIDSFFNSRYKTRMPINNIRSHEHDNEAASINIDFRLLFQKINQNTPIKGYRDYFDFSKIFFRKTKRTRDELFFLLELINLYDVIRLKDIVNIVKSHAPSVEKSRILPLLSILHGADMIKITEDSCHDTCFIRMPNYCSYFEVSYKASSRSNYTLLHETDKFNELKIFIHEYYKKFAPQLISLWEEQDASN